MSGMRMGKFVGTAAPLAVVLAVLAGCTEPPVEPAVDVTVARQGTGTATVKIWVLEPNRVRGSFPPVEGVAVRAFRANHGVVEIRETDEIGFTQFDLTTGTDGYCFFVTPVGLDAFDADAGESLEDQLPLPRLGFPPPTSPQTSWAGVIAQIDRPTHSNPSRVATSLPLNRTHFEANCDPGTKLVDQQVMEFELHLRPAHQVTVLWRNLEGEIVGQGAHGFLPLDDLQNGQFVQPPWFEALGHPADVRFGLLVASQAPGNPGAGLPLGAGDNVWVEAPLTQNSPITTGNVQFTVNGDEEVIGDLVLFMCPIHTVAEDDPQGPQEGNVTGDDVDIRNPVEHGWLGQFDNGDILPLRTAWGGAWNQSGSGSAVVKFWFGPTQDRVRVRYTCPADQEGAPCNPARIESTSAGAAGVVVKLYSKWLEGVTDERDLPVYRLTWELTGVTAGDAEWRVEVDGQDGGDSLPNPARSSGSKMSTPDAGTTPCESAQQTTDDRFAEVGGR